MKIKDELEVRIIDYDSEGIGVAKVDGFPIFVKNVLIGELVKIRITRVTKNIAEGLMLKVLEPSLKRNNNLCKHYYRCGGCNIMHMNYDEQLEFKRNNVKNLLKRNANLDVEVAPVVKNDNIYNYRNKIIVPLKEVNGEILSGFFEANSHKLVSNEDCYIENINSKPIIDEIKRLIKEYKLSIYDEETNKGFFRNIMIRFNKFNEAMVVFVVKNNSEILKVMSKELALKFENIKSIYACINEEKTNVVLKGKFIHLLLDEYLIENINGYKFYVHPNSFLQVNNHQAEKLYQKAISYVNDNDVLIDAYCGIGTISINASSKAKKVVGIEIVKEAIDNANLNKKLNNAENVEFYLGKCEDVIKKISCKYKVDSIIFDPPRKGCDIEFLKTVYEMNIKKIIYISCNPATMARDIKYLIDVGYEVNEVTPFDLFSFSNHVETVCCLIKR